MRLRQLILAVIALGGVWIAVLLQRSGDAPPPERSALSVEPPLTFRHRHSRRLVRVPGLSRPVAADADRVKVTPRPHVATPAAQPAAKPPRVAQGAEASSPRPQVERDGAIASRRTRATALRRRRRRSSRSRSANVQVSRAHVVERTRHLAHERADARADGIRARRADDLDAGDERRACIDHEAVLTGLEFSTTYTVYVHAVDEWNRAQTKT